MQNNDLSRFYPYNPKAPKPGEFVRYDENGKVPGTGGGSVPIGTLTIDHVPSDSELDSYVESQTGRATEKGDTIIVVVTSGSNSSTYNYYYTGTAWDNYKVDSVVLAENGTAGILEGTYNVGSSNNVLVDINGGEIKQIYFKDGSTYKTMSELLSALRLYMNDRLSITGSVTLASGNDSWNSGGGMAGLFPAASMIYTPATDNDRTEAEAIGLKLDVEYSQSGNWYRSHFYSDTTSSNNITLRWLAIFGQSNNQGINILNGIGVSQPTPPTPTNVVTDEFGNIVTDSSNNPITGE